MSLRDLLEPCIPEQARRAVRFAKQSYSEQLLAYEWNRLRAGPARVAVNRPIERILIVPPDPHSLMLGLGDDAMVTSAAEAARFRNPGVEIGILVDGAKAESTARAIGLVPFNIWGRDHFVSEYAALLNTKRFDAVTVLGADVMDGYHSYINSAKMIALCDLAVRRGIPAAVLGFSFSASRLDRLAECFDRADRRVLFNLRDEVSLMRFNAFSSARAQLVADSAFSLEPGSLDEEFTRWIQSMRSEGRKIIGVNLHPMLFLDKHAFNDGKATAGQINTIVQRSVEAIKEISAERHVAWVLLPHDFRGDLGDNVCLAPVYEQLRPLIGQSVWRLTDRMRASEIKAIAGSLDGTVAGRMHMTIASLGAGAPALTITYQDKFEGLKRLFSMPEWLFLPADEFKTRGKFEEVLLRFVDSTDSLRNALKETLPGVLKLSRRNFEIFD